MENIIKICQITIYINHNLICIPRSRNAKYKLLVTVVQLVIWVSNYAISKFTANLSI